MPETPRSSFRLRPRTLDRIDEIRAALKEQSPRYYTGYSKTQVIEEAVDRLHREVCPKPARTSARVD